jgi:hypothetical protein
LAPRAKPNAVFDAIAAFGDDLTEGQRAPTRKAVREMFLGLFTEHLPRLASFARATNRRTYDTNAAEKRYCRHLNSTTYDDAKIEEFLIRRAATFGAADGRRVIAVDTTTLPKPWAHPERPKGMEKASVVYRGSHEPYANETVMGYTVFEADIVSRNGDRLPILRSLVDVNATGSSSMNTVTRDAVAKLAPHLGSDDVITMDAGFESRALTGLLDALPVPVTTVTRLRNDPQKSVFLADSDGDVRKARHIADALDPDYATVISRGVDEKGRPEKMAVEWGFTRVRCTHEFKRKDKKRVAEGPERTLIIAWTRKHRNVPLMLLLSRRVDDPDVVEKILHAYADRWEIEKSNRQEKDRFGFGPSLCQFHVRTLRSIRRLLTLVWAASLASGELRARAVGKTGPRCLKLAKAVAPWTRHLRNYRKEPRDFSYRIWLAIGELLREVPADVARLWARLGSSAGGGHPPRRPS